MSPKPILGHGMLIANSLKISALGILLALPATAKDLQPSFSCKKATSPVEKLICQDQQLATLDRELSEVYLEDLKRAESNTKLQIKADQRSWIANRDSHGDLSGQSERAALKKKYESRIRDLKKPYPTWVPKNAQRWSAFNVATIGMTGDIAIDLENRILAMELFPTPFNLELLEQKDGVRVFRFEDPTHGKRGHAGAPIGCGKFLALFEFYEAPFGKRLDVYFYDGEKPPSAAQVQKNGNLSPATKDIRFCESLGYSEFDAD